MASESLLTHCKFKDDPKRCKSRYPKTDEAATLTRPALICHGLAKQCDLPVKGARSLLGAIRGRRNDEWLNGSHPALLVSLRCNSDVQVPYRFPITPHTHADELCGRSDCCGDDDAAVVYAAQVAQDSQCGYACDYGNKRGPLAINEAKEMQKGMSQLGERLRGSQES